MYTFWPEFCSLHLGRAASAEKIATEALLSEGDQRLAKVIVMLAAALPSGLPQRRMRRPPLPAAPSCMKVNSKESGNL
jgi:hypothetical protein